MEVSSELSVESFSLFIGALKFGARRHSFQKRKDKGGTPYFNHPIEVAETLWSVGAVREMHILTAALLHDVIEDTQTRPDEVEALFGSVILSIVQEVSDDKGLPKGTRKALQIEHAPHLSTKGKLIKLADKICNIRDVIHSPPSDWPVERRIEYLDWAEQVVRGLEGCNAKLEQEFYRILQEGRQALCGGRTTKEEPGGCRQDLE